MLSGNCQERELRDRGAPYVVPTLIRLYPDVLVLCPVGTCMTLVLTWHHACCVTQVLNSFLGAPIGLTFQKCSGKLWLALINLQVVAILLQIKHKPVQITTRRYKRLSVSTTQHVHVVQAQSRSSKRCNPGPS
jgi:hypothetical protein